MLFEHYQNEGKRDKTRNDFIFANKKTPRATPALLYILFLLITAKENPLNQFDLSQYKCERSTMSKPNWHLSHIMQQGHSHSTPISILEPTEIKSGFSSRTLLELNQQH